MINIRIHYNSMRLLKYLVQLRNSRDNSSLLQLIVTDIFRQHNFSVFMIKCLASIKKARRNFLQVGVPTLVINFLQVGAYIVC
jgi:hypothetical protein